LLEALTCAISVIAEYCISARAGDIVGRLELKSSQILFAQNTSHLNAASAKSRANKAQKSTYSELQ